MEQQLSAYFGNVMGAVLSVDVFETGTALLLTIKPPPIISAGLVKVKARLVVSTYSRAFLFF